MSILKALVAAGVVAGGLFALSRLLDSDDNSESSYSGNDESAQYAETKRRAKTEYAFDEDITKYEFEAILDKTRRQFKRVVELSAVNLLVIGTIRTQSGLNTWPFYLDFNDNGKLSGQCVWRNQENSDSNMPKHVSIFIEQEINRLRVIKLLEKKQFIQAHPIPLIDGMNLKDGEALLAQHGFLCETDQNCEFAEEYFIKSYQRSEKELMLVKLKVICKLPLVDGLEEKDALAELRLHHFRYRVEYIYSKYYSDRRIISSELPDCKLLFVKLSVSWPVPDVANIEEQEAINLLQANGINYEVVYRYSDEYDRRCVISSIMPNNKIPLLKLMVSYPVPKVIGLHYYEALEKMETSGFTCECINFYDDSNDFDVVTNYKVKEDGKTVELSRCIGAEIINSKISGIDWNLSPTSTKDEYNVIVHYNRKSKMLLLTLTGKLNCEKRLLIGKRCKVALDSHTHKAKLVFDKKRIIKSGRIFSCQTTLQLKNNQVPSSISFLLKGYNGLFFLHKYVLNIVFNVTWDYGTIDPEEL